jgi:HD-like signal output (HDOD) protein/AmiR/NasT family two-component response regulator
MKKRRKVLSLGLMPKTEEPYTVVIIDDSKIDKVLLKRILMHKEFNVILELSDGKELLERLDKMVIKPHVLFLDYEMPMLNGLDALRKIKELYSDIKVVIITQHTEKDIIANLLQAKADSIIIKPFNEAKIVEKVAIMMGRRDLLPREVIEYKPIKLDFSSIEIPPLPNVTMRVMTFDTSNPQGGSAELEKIIGPDKAISTAILRIANSAFYGRAGTVTSLKDAITLLGMQTVKNLVFLQSKKNLMRNLQSEIFKKHLLELPALNALISFDLSNPLGMKKLGESAFLCSLLKNIGMTILSLNFIDSYSNVLKLSEFGLKSLFQLEKEQFNTDSTIIGEKVFKFWKLPEEFIHVVHNQIFTLKYIESVTDIDRLIKMGEILAKKMSGIVVGMQEDELLNALFKQYEGGEEVRELFNEDYFEMIEDHPFLEMIRQ